MNTTIVGAAVIIFVGIKEATASYNSTSKLTFVMILTSTICALSADIRASIQSARRDAMLKAATAPAARELVKDLETEE